MSDSPRDRTPSEQRPEAEAFFQRFAGVVDDAADALSGNDPLIGHTIRHYRIDARLGEGGMGVVYRAFDTRLNRTVALKFLPDHLNADRRAKERFLIEARAAAALDHPNICTIHEVGETENGLSFIAMAFYDGQTLDALLKAGPLPWQKALDYATQIARGLGAAHDRGIVHRDVKPANVMVTAGGVVKLLDFGIARMAEVSGVTGTGVTLGTTAYMSPEQATGQPVDARTDLWSLGVLLYEMSMGVRPFRGTNATALLHAILSDGPPAPSKSRPELPRVIDGIIARSLEKDPAARYADTAEFLNDLTRAQQATAPQAPAPRRRLLAVTGSLAAIAGLIAVWAIVSRPDQSSLRPSIAVLPFESLSDASPDRTFADAMHDRLISELGTIASIIVMDPMSVRPYRGSAKRPAQAATELNTTHVVTGTAVQIGGEARVSVWLHDAAGRTVWNGVFEQGLTNVFKLQAQVADSIARLIEARLTREEQLRLAGKMSVDTAAANRFALGLRYFNEGGPNVQVTVDSALRLRAAAAGLFEQATQLEPGWSTAWAYLAKARGWEAASSFSTRADSLYRLAKQAADSAIRLDPNESAGYEALGWTLFRWKRDWVEAEKALKKAQSINPNRAHGELGILYMALGRKEDAVRERQSAFVRNPNSPLLRVGLGWAQACAGRYDDALETLDPTLFVSLGPWERFANARVLVRKGDYPQAVSEFNRIKGPDEYPPEGLAYAYYKLGDREKAREIVRQRETRRASLSVNDQAWTSAAGGISDDLALEDTVGLIRRLSTMVDNNDQYLASLKCEPYYEEFIKIPQARLLLEKAKVPI